MVNVLLEAVRSLPSGAPRLALVISLAAGLYGDVYRRVDANSDRLDRQELVTRYTGCLLKESLEGRPTDGCDALVQQDVIEYLRPVSSR
jgi:hypothetical protein